MNDSNRQRDDLIIGDDEWITFVQHDWANVEWFYVDDVLEPLSPLFKRLEIECVAECCGLDAFSFTRDDILAVASKLDISQLLRDLNQAINTIESLTSSVLGSEMLNNGIDRGTLLDLLGHIRQTVNTRMDGTDPNAKIAG